MKGENILAIQLHKPLEHECGRYAIRARIVCVFSVHAFSYPPLIDGLEDLPLNSTLGKDGTGDLTIYKRCWQLTRNLPY
jgi:hypothetical protein